MPADTEQSTIAPEIRPLPVLRIGVTGHTLDIPEERIAATLENVLKLIETAASDAVALAGDVYASTTCRFRMVSCLAPGADQLAAKLTIARGYEQTAVLPGGCDAYSRRLASQSPVAALELGRLLGQSRAVVEVLAASHAKDKVADLDAATTRLVVEHSDILVAIWKEKEAGSGSCTTAGVALAVKLGLPVIVMNPLHPDVWHLHRQSELVTPHQEQSEHLRDIVNAIIGDPYSQSDCTEAEAQAKARTEPSLAEELYNPNRHQQMKCDQRLRRDRYYQESRSARLGKLSTFWREWFYGPTGSQRKRLEKEYRQVHPQDDKKAIEPPGPVSAESLTRISQIQAPLEAPYKRADQLADYYMNLYRSAFAANYLLGGVAVGLAVLAFSHVFHWPWLGSFFAAAELSIIGAIWLIYHRAHNGEWHIRAVDYRLLAEMFRHMKQLAAIASHLPEPPLPEHWRSGAYRGVWTHWYARAVQREFDFGIERSENDSTMLLVIDEGYCRSAQHVLLREWITDQMNYHGSSWRRYTILSRHLHRWTKILFLAVIVACTLHLLTPLLAYACECAWGENAETGTKHSWFSWEALWETLLICIGAAAPAFGAALHAISTQSESRRLARSYERMESSLGVLEKRLTDAPPTLAALQAVALDTATIMLAEVEDWQTAYRFHEVTTA